MAQRKEGIILPGENALFFTSEHEPNKYFAQLMIISPQHAGRIGIPVESPVFVGVNRNKTRRCDDCGRHAAPTIYQTGYVIESRHPKCSEAYLDFDVFDKLMPGKSLYGNGDSPWKLEADVWLANVEPMGDIRTSALKDPGGKEHVFRSANQLLIKEIFLLCMPRGVRASQGVLYRDTRIPESRLLESCGDQIHGPQENAKPAYQFRIKNGQVSFSPYGLG